MMNAKDGLEFVFGFFQAWYGVCTHENDLAWNEIDLVAQTRQVRQDVLNNLREEVYDILDVSERSLETNLLVATLMLGFGFGFACEGTFPDEKNSAGQWAPRYVYTAAAALGLVLPFLSMMGFLECRKRLHQFITTFNEAFSNERVTEGRRFQDRLSDSERLARHARRRTRRLPGFPWLSRLCCTRRAQIYATPQLDQDPPDPNRPAATDIFNEWTTAHVKGLQSKSEKLLRAGVGSLLLAAALLIGMHFQSRYPDTPDLWMVYAAIVSCGLLVWVLSLLAAGLRAPANPQFVQPFLAHDGGD